MLKRDERGLIGVQWWWGYQEATAAGLGKVTGGEWGWEAAGG